ncbi:MAG TPA: VOC family protein [Actinomycetota bacterium]|nr:VOC family protein [Actinomycetota bacterium]
MPVARRMNHVHIRVSDLDRSIRFYGAAFGLSEAYRDEEDGEILVFLTTAEGDVLTLNSASTGAGTMGGVEHFGFRVPGQLADCVNAVTENGGTFLGNAGWEPDHVAYVRDPDGYVVEIDGRPE